jgi:autotransporter-associated beta strand protein
MKRSSFLLTFLFTLGIQRVEAATDGSWVPTAGGNQDWGTAANWVGSTIADGADGSAIFNVNLAADQTVTGAGGRTIGHLFFQDTDTASQGGFNLGLLGEGSLTLDVSSGRSIVNVGNLNTGGGKKVSLIDPIINADGILKIGAGQFSIRAHCPGMSSDYVATGGLTDTRSNLTSLTSLLVLGGAQFQMDFPNALAGAVNLLGTTVPVTLGGTVLVPPPAIPPTLPLVVNNPVSGGGILTITGRNGSANTQTVASVTLNRGSHTISLTTGTGAGAAAQFDPTTFTRNAGAAVNFNTTATATNVMKAGGLANDANGIIGGWAINGTNWATVSGGNIGFLASGSYTTSTDPTTWAAGNNVSPSTNPIAAIGTRTINTLRLTANNTNSIGVGNVLTLADGGLLGSAGVHQFNDGTLQGPAGGELIIHQTGGTNLMNSIIADNTSASTLIKSGGGLLALSGANANTYSGGTYVNQGTLQIGDGLSGGNGGSLGSGSVTLLSGSLFVNKTNDMTLTNGISGSGPLVKQGAGTLTLNCVGTQNGYNLSAPGSTSGSLGLVGTRLDAGTIALMNDTSLGGTFRFQLGNTTLRSANANTRTIANNVDVASSPVILGAPGSGDLVFQGIVDTGAGAKTFNVSNTVSRLDGIVRGTGANAVTKAGPGTLVLGSTASTTVRPWAVTQGNLRISDEACLGVNPAAFAAGQITLNGGALETTTTMTIDDGSRGIAVGAAGGAFNVNAGTTLTISAAGLISGIGGTLIKAGSGTLVVQSANIYSGSTLINGGTLFLDAGASIATSPTIIVGNGATFDVSAFGGFTLAANQTLGGGGTVVGNVSGSGSSVISPGSSPGTLTFSNDLSLASGDGVTFDLTNNTTIGSGVNDLLVVNGNLNLNNNVVTIRPLAPGGALANGTYRLVNYNGIKTGSFSINSGTRFSLSLDESITGQVNLNVSGNPASLVWRGDSSTSWDIANSPNWRNGGNPDVFFNFDSVRFDDSATSFIVTLNETVLPTVVVVSNTFDYLFDGPAAPSGTMTVTKDHTGTLILGNFGTNDYTGPTIINGGTLQIGQNDGSGIFGGSAISNNAILRFRNSGTFLTISNLSGPGALFAEGNNQDLILAFNNTFSGATTVGTNARLAIYGTAGSTFASLGSTPSINVLSDGAFYTTVAGVYTQALTLNGDGFAGESSGALRVGNVNAGWSGPITLASGASIGNDGSTLTISNGISGGSFALTKAGAGTLLLVANNTYGDTTINEGPLQIGNGGTSGSLGSGGTINDNWYLAVNRSDDITISANISGTGGLLKSGLNTLTLSGNNSYTGTYNGTATPLGTGAAGTVSTRLDGGTLAVGSDTAVGTSILRLNNAAAIFRSADASARTIGNLIDMAADITLGSATSGNLIFTAEFNCGAAAKTFTISNSVTSLNGILSGGDSANNNTKNGPGTLVLNGNATHNKPTVVNLGTLMVNGALSSTRALTVAGGTLGGTGTISGPVTIQPAGTLSPGPTIGTLAINNTLTLSGTNVMELNKTAGTNDLIQGMTSVTYGGVLSVANLSGTLAAGDSFKLYDATSYGGAFSSITPATPGTGLVWDTSQLNTSGRLGVQTSAVIITNNGLQLTWPGGGTLQASDDLITGPFVDLDPAPSSPYTMTPSEASQYYRVRTGQPAYTFYDTEMLQLDISGGSLPPGAKIRISPTLPSRGKTAMQQKPDGTSYTIVSYFTNNIEMSLDNGSTWTPPTNGPHKVKLIGPPLNIFPTNLVPPLQWHYTNHPPGFYAVIPPNIIITNIVHHGWTNGFPPPPPGGVTNDHTFFSIVDGKISLNGGSTFNAFSAPANTTVRVISRP